MTEDFQRLLDTDALAEAEKITGRSYKEDPLTKALGFGMHIRLTETKREELALRDDTYYASPWTDTLRIYRDLGFEIVHSHRFPSSRQTVELDAFVVLWRLDGVLATAESYGDATNSSKIYYNWRPNEDLESRWGITSSGGFHRESYDAGDEIWVGHHDVREAIRHKLARLESNGTFVVPWVARPFLWLLDYSQPKVEGFDYKKITGGVVATLPEHVLVAITTEA